MVMEDRKAAPVLRARFLRSYVPLRLRSERKCVLRHRTSLSRRPFSVIQIRILYQIPRTCCIPRLTSAIPTQQQKPVKMGLPPVFISLTIFVFRPMAAIAMMMRNLLRSLSGAVTSAGSWKSVVIMEARTKNNTK